MTNLEGQRYIIFGGDNEEEARNRGIEKIGFQFDIISLPTRNRHTASAMVKGQLLEKSGNLHTSVKRLRHKIKL